ncbi:MAG: hypothetical protein WCY43_00775 [Patescibacteria group bacterium]|nr:hypothetical protein [Patescibacteria group bacterium]
MKLLLKILNVFFVFLGVIFFILILGVIYFFVFDPFNLKTFIPEDQSLFSTTKNLIFQRESVDPNIDRNPLLNSEQEVMLESVGVDTSKLPSEITPEMQKCFIEKLGQERASEIIGGSSPTAGEIISANSCLK